MEQTKKDIRRSIALTEDQEREIGADFTDILQPADDGYFFACVSKPKLSTGMGSGLEHIALSPYSII